MRMNPVCRREMKTSARNIRMFLILLGYNALLALIGIVAFYFNFGTQYYANSFNYANIIEIYFFLTGIEFLLVVFSVPAFTSGSISGEREKQTLEILLTARLKPGQIICGKLLSSIGNILLLIVSSLPVLSIVFGIGGIRMLDLIHFMLTCTVTAIFIGSIGMYFSTFFKRTIPATVATYGTILLLVVGTAALVMIAGTIVVNNYNTWYYAIENNTVVYDPPGIDGLLYILLLNPAVSLISVVTKQMGSLNSLESYFARFGTIPDFFYEYWFVLSSVLQLGIAFVLLCFAARNLNPMKGKKVIV